MVGSTTAPVDQERLGASARALAPKLVASVLIAISFVLVLRRGGLPIWPEASALSLVNAWALLGYALLFGLATFLRTYRRQPPHAA